MSLPQMLANSLIGGFTGGLERGISNKIASKFGAPGTFSGAPYMQGVMQRQTAQDLQQKTHQFQTDRDRQYQQQQEGTKDKDLNRQMQLEAQRYNNQLKLMREDYRLRNRMKAIQQQNVTKPGGNVFSDTAAKIQGLENYLTPQAAKGLIFQRDQLENRIKKGIKKRIKRTRQPEPEMWDDVLF